MRQQIVEEVLNDAALGSEIEIDQHVAAKDDIHALHECHARIVGEIEPGEADVGASQRIYLELVALRNKVSLPVSRREVAHTVVAVDAGFGMRERALIDIRGKNFNGPVFERTGRLLQLQHTQGVRFFSRGAARAPDAESAQWKFGFNLKNVWQHDSA